MRPITNKGRKMKTLRFAAITLLAFLTIGFATCNKNDNGNNGNNTNDEIIEYQGEYPAPENIEYVEDGVTYEIEAIPGQVVIISDKDYNIIVNAVNAQGGKIIEQNPQFGYYLIEVTTGIEKDFITTMNDLSITAEYNIVEYSKEKDYYVFDDYADLDGDHHGKHISEILSMCQTNSTIKEVNVYNVYDGSTSLSIVLSSLGKHLASQNRAFVNLSLGYGDDEDNWDIMSANEKKSFMKGWKKDIKSKLDFIIALKKKNPNIDIVIANAAGNERCPLASIINSLKSDPNYKTVMEENLIIVSDYSYYANTSSTYGDFGYIKDHPYYNENGGTTSMATPQALCFINQVMKETIGEDGKNITAVQALAAVKAAIRQNSNGELDLDEALEMARIMYSPMSHEIIVTPNKLTFEAISGGYQVVNVVVNSVNPLQWTATCNESWVHLSVTSGTNDTNVQVSVDNNNSTTARSTMITFTTETRSVGVVTVNQEESEINGDWVDLGLPSGILWATHNVGASTPEGYGDYFAWGETVSKTTYNWDTYKYGYLDNEGFGRFTKYVVDACYGPVDNLSILEPMDDAATVNWGNGWRMPTYWNWLELRNYTTNIWTTQNGVNGRLFTGNNGKSLFLPAAGSKYPEGLTGAGTHGHYWSSSLYSGGFYSYNFEFSSTSSPYPTQDQRYEGYTVRPVRSTK